MRLQVLIVEDDPILALDLEDTITDLGHHVCATADNAREAAEAALRCDPDLVLMDFCLIGDGDGVDAAQSIRRHSVAPIIFITAHADTTCRARMQSVDRCAILPKPHTTEMIAKAVDHAERLSQ